MFPEEHLMTALREDELWLEQFILELKKDSTVAGSAPRSMPELEKWLLKSGMSPVCYLSQNRIGFYADFT